MSNAHDARQRPPHMPYTSMHSGSAAQDAHALSGARTEREHADFLAVEAERLQSVRWALWDAFKSLPPAALPVPLIDLVTAYTSTLRLQLNLMSNPRRPAPTKTPEPGAKTTIKSD